MTTRIAWRGWRIGLIAFILLQFMGKPNSAAHAARGIPGSAEFGFGAHLDPWGSQTELAIKAAFAIGLDWLAIDFDWSRHWVEQNDQPVFERIDPVLAQIGEYNMNVLVSITSPPAWALTPSGPDPVKVAHLLAILVDRYGNNISAIELFPGANTTDGWGAVPNPQAYASLLQHAHQALEISNSSIMIVGAGLKPLLAGGASDDEDDLVYLAELYQAGAAGYMPIVSLHLESLSMTGFTEGGEIDTRALRHYESVRRVMVENKHGSGLIWVTAYKLPEFNYQDTAIVHQMQIRWLNQALLMMKSQLYIGVAFIDPLNPAFMGTSSNNPAPSLIRAEAGEVSMHPAFSALGQIITTVHTGHNNNFQLSLYKKISNSSTKSVMKGNRQ